MFRLSSLLSISDILPIIINFECWMIISFQLYLGLIFKLHFLSSDRVEVIVIFLAIFPLSLHSLFFYFPFQISNNYCHQIFFIDYRFYCFKNWHGTLTSIESESNKYKTEEIKEKNKKDNNFYSGSMKSLTYVHLIFFIDELSLKYDDL